jgi:hypothetical protein
MYSLSGGLKQTGTSSARGLRAALGSPSSSVIQLLQTAIIHQHYLESDGRRGPFGFPTSDVSFSDRSATRDYRGGSLRVKDADGPTGTIVQAISSTTLRVTFLGFKCVSESSSDQLSSSDEPYFAITAQVLGGFPMVKKFGPFEGTDSGDEVVVGEVLLDGVPPNPLAIKVMAYEHDLGDPDETAKKIQDKALELAKEGEKLAGASGADSASGAGIGPAAGAATLSGIIAGPFGALAAAGIVSALGLGDDFVGQNATLAFQRPENVTTPPDQGTFQGNPFNAKIEIDGGDEGHYELFFALLVLFDPGPHTV